MSRITTLFASRQNPLLNIYFTAGFPALEDTKRIILTLDKAGVDLVEVGIPYSDPLADGPTIQASGTRALKNGMSLDLLLTQVEEARQETDLPIILMGYLNQLMQYGVERFLERCETIGVDGLIIPDLPIDVFEKEWYNKIDQNKLNFIFLITPQTSEERIRKIDRLSSGFIYMVSDSSITGAKGSISDKQIAYFKRVDGLGLVNPRLIGFGISSHETFVQACTYSRGAIIGSAFINALASDDHHLEEKIISFVNKIKKG
jgi:tryptophan synthase alpha chain